MYNVSGFNMFGQWLLEDSILHNFRNVSLYKNISILLKYNPTRIKILEISWSYNIFLIDNDFYIIGACRGKENQCFKLELPAECQQYLSKKETPFITMIGNDYDLLLINQETYDIWLINLEKCLILKKLKLGIDMPMSTADSKRPKRNDNIVKAVATNSSVLYLMASGVVYCGLVPTYLPLDYIPDKICDIASGYEHFMLLTDTGRVYSWGNGRRLQLGHGDINNLETPQEVEALGGLKIVKISAGGWHSLVLTDSGDLYSWGWNDAGQLGIKNVPEDPQSEFKIEGLKSFPNPTLVELYDDNFKELTLNVKDIGCGSKHSAIVLEDNSVWCSGNNKYGQLGTDPDEFSSFNYFRKVFQFTGEFRLKCGLWSTILIKDE